MAADSNLLFNGVSIGRFNDAELLNCCWVSAPLQSHYARVWVPEDTVDHRGCGWQSLLLLNAVNIASCMLTSSINSCIAIAILVICVKIYVYFANLITENKHFGLVKLKQCITYLWHLFDAWIQFSHPLTESVESTSILSHSSSVLWRSGKAACYVSPCFCLLQLPQSKHWGFFSGYMLIINELHVDWQSAAHLTSQQLNLPLFIHHLSYKHAVQSGETTQRKQKNFKK